jgi:DNA-binding transcriptional LysR family regulator
VLQEVDVSGDYLSDDGEIVRRWALAGHGIAYKARLDVRIIAAGRLVRCSRTGKANPRRST